MPTHNGRRLLAEALEGLSRQTLAGFETIVVDDGSTDDTLAWLGRRRPSVRVIVIPRCQRLAFAMNRGLEFARGDRIALLNNDAVPDPGWLEALDRAFDAHPEAGSLASRIVLYDRPDLLHAAGDTYTTSGLPGNRGAWGPATAYPSSGEVFGASAAAAAYRRELFDAVGGFDEDLVMYCEDVDLDWRAQLAGFRCRYVPEARVRHRVGATAGGSFESFLVGRNRILVAAANLPGFVWRRHWWQINMAQLRLAVDALVHLRGEAARATMRGQLAAFPRLWQAWRKRRERIRRVSDQYLWSLLD